MSKEADQTPFNRQHNAEEDGTKTTAITGSAPQDEVPSEDPATVLQEPVDPLRAFLQKLPRSHLDPREGNVEKLSLGTSYRVARSIPKTSESRKALSDLGPESSAQEHSEEHSDYSILEGSYSSSRKDHAGYSIVEGSISSSEDSEDDDDPSIIVTRERWDSSTHGTVTRTGRVRYGEWLAEEILKLPRGHSLRAYLPKLPRGHLDPREGTAIKLSLGTSSTVARSIPETSESRKAPSDLGPESSAQEHSDDDYADYSIIVERSHSCSEDADDPRTIFIREIWDSSTHGTDTSVPSTPRHHHRRTENDSWPSSSRHHHPRTENKSWMNYLTVPPSASRGHHHRRTENSGWEIWDSSTYGTDTSVPSPPRHHHRRTENDSWPSNSRHHHPRTENKSWMDYLTVPPSVSRLGAVSEEADNEFVVIDQKEGEAASGLGPGSKESEGGSNLDTESVVIPHEESEAGPSTAANLDTDIVATHHQEGEANLETWEICDTADLQEDEGWHSNAANLDATDRHHPE